MASVRTRRWSQHVFEHSNALDLQPNVFANDDPAAIARSLKKSADQRDRRKSDPFRSAMSMLSFYINRAGSKFSKKRLATLEAAKDELRGLYRKHAPPVRRRS